MSLPLISVVIPCYNQGAFVGEAVDSVLAQTVQDFEILVLDDGSDDDRTRETLARARWPRTTVFRTENLGLARARNFLLARARGDYLCALDADDKLHPRYLETTLSAFGDPGLTFVSTRLQMFGEAHAIAPPDLSCNLPTLLCHCPVFSAALVRREAVAGVGGYDPQLPGNEDWDLWISLLEAGGKGIILPDVLFYYRRRSGSMCDLCTRGQLYLDHFQYLTRKHRRSYQRHLLDVLTWQERQLGEQRLAHHRLSAEIRDDLEAVVERRQSELRTLQARFAGVGDRPPTDSKLSPMTARQPPATVSGYHALQSEYDRCVQEVAALKASRSWKATAPLRAAYELLLAWRSRPKV